MERFGGSVDSIAGPARTELAGESTFHLRPGKDEYVRVGILLSDHLEDEVRRGAEAGQPEVLPVLKAGQPQRPIADRTAQEGGRLRHL